MHTLLHNPVLYVALLTHFCQLHHFSPSQVTSSLSIEAFWEHHYISRLHTLPLSLSVYNSHTHTHTGKSCRILPAVQRQTLQQSGADCLSAGLHQSGQDREVLAGSRAGWTWAGGAALLPRVSGEAGLSLPHFMSWTLSLSLSFSLC